MKLLKNNIGNSNNNKTGINNVLIKDHKNREHFEIPYQKEIYKGPNLS